MSGKIFTLNQNNRSLSVVHKEKHYVIGFKNITLARKIYFTIEKNPNIDIIRYNDIKSKLKDFNITINFDTEATLFIKKKEGAVWSSMFDVGYYINEYKDNEFFLFPIEKQLGIVMPYKLEEETEYEYMLKALIIDPTEEVVKF